MDIQRIEGFAGRESLPAGVLIELLFEESVGELEEQRKANKIYPRLAIKRKNKKILAYENFTKWVVALIHPYPGNRASLLDVLDLPINSQDSYSWVCKNQSSLSFSSKAKLFIKTFEENRIKGNQPIVDRPPHTVPHKSSNARREVGKLNTQSRHKGWQKTYLVLKRKNPDKSDNWYAREIAKMDIAQGRSSETIRKNMKI